MRLGMRGRLFAISLGLIGTVGLAAALWLQSSLEEIVTDQLRKRLTYVVFMSRVAFDELGPSPSMAEVDALADRLGAAGHVRITVIAPEGHLLGDSELDMDGLRGAENHINRPEVLDARSTPVGVKLRYSTTLDESMLYVAARRSGDRGYVRAAVPLSALNEPLERFRTRLIPVGALALLVAIVMSAIASQLTLRPLSSLVRRARRLASHTDSIPLLGQDELGYVAGSLERLAAQLGRSVSALAQERDRLDAVLRGMGEGVIALDGELRLRTVNPAARRMLGVAASTAEGQRLVTLNRSPDLLHLAEQALSEQCGGELTLGDRPALRLRVSGAPLRATGGCLLVLHDVTEVRRLEQVRRDFVANVSHELRTPVAVIRANSETLLDGALDNPAAARTFAEASLRHAERLSNLLSDLLDLARLEADAYGLSLTRLPLRATLQGALGSIGPLAEQRRIELTLEAPEGVYLQADAKGLDQVLVNLLSNAVKYTQEGGHVTLHATVSGGHVRIEVRDDGPGISREHRDRIFERFYRVDAGRSREVGGTGLGLSIVKHLVGAMQGEVGVEPNKPRGCVFWLKLRVAADEAGDGGAKGKDQA